MFKEGHWYSGKTIKLKSQRIHDNHSSILIGDAVSIFWIIVDTSNWKL